MLKDIGVAIELMQGLIGRKKLEEVEPVVREHLLTRISEKMTLLDPRQIAKLATASKKPIELYIHIPFCDRICGYCGFPVIVNKGRELRESYFEAFSDHVRKVLPAGTVTLPLESVFIGGGTPSTLSIEEVDQYFNLLAPRFQFDQAPKTFEMHPFDVSIDYVRALRALGITRFSVGLQNLVASERDGIQRNFTTPEYDIARLKEMNELGVIYNVDLIYGSSNQTLDNWRETIERLVDEVHPPEITTYLYVDINGTGTFRRHRYGRLERPSIGLKRQMYYETRAILTAAGYHQENAINYSLSKLTKTGETFNQSKNILGLGPRTFSQFENYKIINNSSVRAFIAGDSENYFSGAASPRISGWVREASLLMTTPNMLTRALKLDYLHAELVSQFYGLFYAIQNLDFLAESDKKASLELPGCLA